MQRGEVIAELPLPQGDDLAQLPQTAPDSRVRPQDAKTTKKPSYDRGDPRTIIFHTKRHGATMSSRSKELARRAKCHMAPGCYKSNNQLV